MSEHAKENCAFYPGCYYAGDCDLDDWAKQNCGLPPAMKAEARQVFRDRMTSTPPELAFPDKRTERLRRILHCYGDRIPMAMCHRPDWQQEIDEAMEWVADNPEERGDPFKETSDV